MAWHAGCNPLLTSNRTTRTTGKGKTKMFYVVIKDDAIVGLFKSYLNARLLQRSTNKPLEFSVVKVNDLNELYQIFNSSGNRTERIEQLSLAY